MATKPLTTLLKELGPEIDKVHQRLLRQDQLILASARMALRHYGDLRDEHTGEQMKSSDKEDIINCNEQSWLARVKQEVKHDQH